MKRNFKNKRYPKDKKQKENSYDWESSKLTDEQLQVIEYIEKEHPNLSQFAKKFGDMTIEKSIDRQGVPYITVCKFQKPFSTQFLLIYPTNDIKYFTVEDLKREQHNLYIMKAYKTFYYLGYKEQRVFL